jgi:Spy/CpxP family protein refolding chaperone
MKNKHSFRLITTGTLILATLAAPTQQSAAGACDEQTQHASQSGATKVEQHLKLLTEKLDLTRDQQAKVKPILQELNDAAEKVMKDESTTPDERMEKMRPLHERADKQIRKILSDEQQKKLDQFESEAHPEMHGG